MSHYIYIGVALKIIIKKQKADDPQKIYTAEEILEKLENQFNLYLYDIAENDEVVGLSLKERIVREHLYPFLKAQAEDLAYSENIKKELQKIKNKDGHDILLMFQNYQLDYIYYNDNDYFHPSYMDSDLDMYIEGITYLSDGKIIMENNNELFYYIHRLLRKSSQYLLKDATYITMN